MEWFLGYFAIGIIVIFLCALTGRFGRNINTNDELGMATFLLFLWPIAGFIMMIFGVIEIGNYCRKKIELKQQGKDE